MLLLVRPWRCRIPLAYFPVCIRLAVWYTLSLMGLLFSCGLIVEELRLLFGPWERRGIIAGAARLLSNAERVGECSGVLRRGWRFLLVVSISVVR
jgi:hypothetical protein